MIARGGKFSVAYLRYRRRKLLSRGCSAADDEGQQQAWETRRTEPALGRSLRAYVSLWTKIKRCCSSHHMSAAARAMQHLLLNRCMPPLGGRKRRSTVLAPPPQGWPIPAAATRIGPLRGRGVYSWSRMRHRRRGAASRLYLSAPRGRKRSRRRRGRDTRHGLDQLRRCSRGLGVHGRSVGMPRRWRRSRGRFRRYPAF